MIRLSGVGASSGIAIGPAHVLDHRIHVDARTVEPVAVASELDRLDRALAESNAQLEHVQHQIAEREGVEHEYRILEAHRLMLGDVHLTDEARRLIRDERCAAEWAVRRALDQIREVFDRIEDPYFRERRNDIDLVGQRLLRNLVGAGDPAARAQPAPGAVVVAHDLAPADVAQLKRAGATGFCTEGGGKTSHTTIVARALGLPYVVGVPGLLGAVRGGARVIVDGARGDVIADPDEDALSLYTARSARVEARAERLGAGRDRPAETACGTRVVICANLELLEEIPAAVEMGCESVGLFRTEFLYLERADLPTEEEQYEHAVQALRALGGRRATFRTLDLSGDKLPSYARMSAGANPALGLRSIRYSLWRRDVFRTQLRALYRAAAEAPARIMFPLISGVAELREARAVCEEVCAELQREGRAHDPNTPLGVMIETPSAAMVADLLACECEFLSIGTNDLIQYALAADRENEHVGYLYHPLHPAIVRLLKLVVDGARKAGTEVAMCGDMAGDPLYTWVLIGLGLRELSMAPRQMPIVKSIVRGTRVAEAEALVSRALDLRTEGEVEALVEGVMRSRFPMEMDQPDAEAEAHA